VDQLPPAVVRALQTAHIPAESVSIVVQDIATQDRLLGWNADVPRNPASLMKLVTTYSALMAMGPAKTWETEIRGLEPMDGILEGNLYIAGVGDPGLTLEHWQAMLRALRIRGVREIRGNLVLDTSRFVEGAQDPNGFDHQGYRAYNTVPEALQVGFKAVTLTLESVGGRVMASPNFDLPGLVIENGLSLRAGPCPEDWKSTFERRVSDDGRTAHIVLSGGYVASCGKKMLSYNILSNDSYIFATFTKIWGELGGGFHGKVMAGKAPAGLPVLVSHASPALAEQIREINKFSNNLMARTLFLDLGWTEGMERASADASVHRVRDILAQEGMQFPELVMENGSGLSREARITAGHLSQLLVGAAHGPYQAEFIASLGLLGMDGTVDKRMPGEGLEGRFHLKTGSLEGVSALAGYGLTRTGRPVSLVILVNHAQVVGAKSVQDALLRWIGKELTAD
jgi:D-alanyl-D-alanine carboxypeptidase/D-alanyl-D-alanine-endopeptidase (penicillin-binding protein 4)